jgi:hypothetical protein
MLHCTARWHDFEWWIWSTWKEVVVAYFKVLPKEAQIMKYLTLDNRFLDRYLNPVSPEQEAGGLTSR